MEFQEIEVTIDKKGQVHIHVRGAAGEICLELTAELEKILGSEILQREFTPEYQEKPKNTTQLRLENKT